MYQYSNSLIRQFPSLVTGNAAVGVQATVYVGETNTLAQLFEVGGAAKSNPVTTDAKGFYSFSLADGDYRIVFSNSQFATLRISVLDGAQIREDFDDLVASNTTFRNEQQAAYDAFVLSNGLYPVAGSFEAGGTITERNQVLQRTTAPAAYFSWGGALPKVVPASSTVAGTGGEGVTAWTNRNDATFAALLGAVDSDVPIAGVPAFKIANSVKTVLNPLDFGGFFNGIDDDGPAIRRALDAVPAWGGVVQLPANRKGKIVGTVFIPQRLNPETVDGNGIVLDMNFCIISGDGTNNIFESGSGFYSTVALGGKSNWSEPNESGTSIHYNSQIRNGILTNFKNGLRLKNFIHGCLVDNVYGADFSERLIHTNRCFYLGIRDIQGRPIDTTRADTMPILEFFDSNNTMTFDNVHVSGITGLGTKTSTGILFDGGVQGIELPAGLSVEGCKRGIVLKSFIYSLVINGVYTELNEIAIMSDGANILHMDILGVEFEDNVVDVNIDGWLNGTFYASNKVEAAVTFGGGCRHTVELPDASYTTSTHTAFTRFPVGWAVPAGCIIRRNDIIFNEAEGFGSVLFRHGVDGSGGAGVIPENYTGECFNVDGLIPFCTVITPSAGTMLVQTKIGWSANLSTIRFDIAVNDDVGGNKVIAGVVSAKNRVFRDDSDAAVVTPVEVGGFVRLDITGLGTITGFSGKVRII